MALERTLQIYEQAVHAPKLEAFQYVMLPFSPEMKAYLGRFDAAELYQALSGLQDLTKTSQGAEAQMSADLRNRIRSCEPQTILSHVLLTQRTGFLKHQAMALTSKDPVPPYMEKHIASLITRAHVHQPTVQFVTGTNQMEATIRSYTNGSSQRMVSCAESSQTPPLCCAYSQQSTGFPCLHGVAFIAEKHSSTNVHMFVDRRHLNSTWKGQ